MTIGANNRNDAVGSSSTATYPYQFKVFAATDLVVTVRDPSNVETVLTYPTHYSVTNVGNKNGGNVVLTDVDGAWQDAATGYLTTGWAITIRRVRPLTQTTDIRNQGGFFADAHEDTFDHLMMVDQQQQDELDRSLKLTTTELGTSAATTIPAADARASKVFFFDENGNPQMVGAIESGLLGAQLADTSNIVNGDALIGVKNNLSNAVAMALHDWIEYNSINVFGFMTPEQRADVLAKTYLVDVSDAVENATNAANGRGVKFPHGGYLVGRQLALTVWRYAWFGERSERGCNGFGFDGNYAGVIIRYRPAVSTTPMVKRTNTAAPLSGIIGPFRHENITFDCDDNNLLQFGDETLGVVTDGAGEKYVFGVSFKGAAFHAAGGFTHDNTTKVITRTGQKILHMTKCFDSIFDDVSFLGGDVQIRMFGCDAPRVSRLRMQSGFAPVELIGSGSFTVMHTLTGVEFEGWGGVAVRASAQTSLTDVSFENGYGHAGSGRHTLPQTATVTAGDGTVVFSASVEGKLIPDISIIEITSGSNVEYCLVRSVSGTDVEIDTLGFSFTWSAAGCTVVRIHGYCAMYDGGHGMRVVNAAGGGDTDVPVYVLVSGSGFMSIANHIAVPGTYNDIQSRVLGNHHGGQNAMGFAMSFTNCNPLVVADPGHPMVITNGPVRENHGELWQDASNRQAAGDFGAGEAQVRRKWVWSPKQKGYTSANNNHLITFKRLAGDANTAENIWAWRIPAGDTMYVSDNSIPSVTSGGLRLRIKCRGDAGSATITLNAIGNGGADLLGYSVVVGTSWTILEFPIGTMPAPWVGARGSPAALQIGSATNNLFVAGVVLIDEDDNERGFAANGMVSNNVAGKISGVAMATPTRLFTAAYANMVSSVGYGGKVKLKASGTTGGTEAYSGCYAEYSLQFTTFGGALAVYATGPAQLVKQADTINAGVQTLDVVLTAAVAAGVLEVFATVTTGGGTPATSALVDYEAEVMSEKPIRLIHG